jgi:hypothetical protein
VDQIIQLLSQPVLLIRPEALQEMIFRLARGETFEPFALSSQAATRTASYKQTTAVNAPAHYEYVPNMEGFFNSADLHE